MQWTHTRGFVVSAKGVERVRADTHFKNRAGLLALLLVIGSATAWLGEPGAAEARPGRIGRWLRPRLTDTIKRSRIARARRRSLPVVTRGNPVRQLPGMHRGRLVFGVMGSAAPEKTIPGELRGRLERMGRSIAGAGHVLLTGACPGMPQVTARAAKARGGATVGVSPAGSLREHVKRFRSPTRNLDVIQMTGCGAGMGLIAREKQNIRHSDILVFTGGRSGTLGEILFAAQEPKVIALLEGSGGVTSKYRRQIMPIVGRGRAVYVSDRDPARLIAKAVQAHARLQRRTPRGSSTLSRLGSSLRRGARRTARALRRRLPRWLKSSAMVSSPVVTDATRRRHNVYTFFGDGRGMSAADRGKVRRLTDLLAADRTGGRTPVVVAPTRRGLVSQVVRRAKARGARTVGISAAHTPRQLRRDRASSTGFDRVQLTGEGRGVGELAAYQHAIKRSDVVFVAGGDHRTLGGTVFAMYQPTVVAVLETGGMSGKLRSHILSTFNKPAHAKMLYDTDPARLVRRATRAAARLRNVQRTEYVAAE